MWTSYGRRAFGPPSRSARTERSSAPTPTATPARRRCGRSSIGDPESDVTRKREAIEDVPLTVSTRIRITLDALSKMRDGTPGLEARFSDQHIALSVFTFDDQMLVTPHLSSLLGHDSPMFHLRRLTDDGLYDRFAGPVAALWKGTERSVWG